MVLFQDKNTRIIEVMSVRQIAQRLTEVAHRKHATRCLHGINTTDTESSKQILHSRAL